MAEPFLKRQGSKAGLMPQLGPFLRVEFDRLVEPFAGTASVTLAIQPQRVLLNDVDRELIECLQTVGADLGGVTDALRRTPFTEDSYYDQRDMDPSRVQALSAAERAARVIFISNAAFNGLARKNREGRPNAAWGARLNEKKRPALEQRIRVAAPLLGRADYQAGDFEPVVNMTGPGDLLFVDAPYHKTFVGYVGEGFDDADQERLAKALQVAAERGVKVVTTNSDTPFIRALYGAPGWHLSEFKIRRNISGHAAVRKAATELCFSSFEPETRASPLTGKKPSGAGVHVQTEAKKLQTMHGKGRQSNERVRERHEFVAELLKQGLSRGQVVKSVRERFGLSERSVDSYIAAVREQWAAEAIQGPNLTETRLAERAAFVQKIDVWLAKAEQAGVLSVVPRLLMLEAEVRGLRQLRQPEPAQPAAVQNNMVIMQGGDLSDAERQHRLTLLRRILDRRDEPEEIESEGEQSSLPELPAASAVFQPAPDGRMVGADRGRTG